jgi:GTP-binding protein
MEKLDPPKLLATAYRPDQLLPLRGPAVIFLGRSNVGKSSLLNALFKKSMARVAKSPGKTRSVNYYRWGTKLTLVDLPGYGYAKRSHEERDQWQILLKEFFDKLPQGTWALLLIDSKRDLEKPEHELMEALRERVIPVTLLGTKSDRLSQRERQSKSRYLEDLLAQYSDENTLTFRFVSAKTGEGIDALRRQLYKYAKEFKT